MTDAGYFAKRVDVNPSRPEIAGIREVCSVSHHISSAPDGWGERWLHNEFGWFNRASDALAVVPAEQVGDDT